MKHGDQKLNLLRALAFGAVGVYLYKVYRTEGNLNGVMKNPTSFGVNSDKVVDSVLPWLNLKEEHQDLIREAGKEVLRTYLKNKQIPIIK